MRKPTNLLYFTSKTCNPSKKLLPQVEQLVAENSLWLKLVVIDIDGHPQVSSQAGVMAVPTILFTTTTDQGPITEETDRLLPTSASIKNIKKRLEEQDA